MNLKGKAALVTGGTRGIGSAAALSLARAGADVALMARTADSEAALVCDQIRCLGVRAELILGDCAKPGSIQSSVRAAAEKLGPIDVLVHSAGGPMPGGLMEVSPENWHAAFDVHVHAIYYLCREVIPMMRKKGEGAVVLVSSTAGIRGVITNVAYQVVKGALPQMTRALAREFAPDNIRINCVAPGVIRTRFHDNMTPEQKKLNLEQRIPLKREGKPEQVASVILELVQNDYITGETVTIDGGLTMRIA